MDNTTIAALLFLGYGASAIFLWTYGGEDMELGLKLHLGSQALMTAAYISFLARAFLPEPVSALAGGFFSYSGLAFEMSALEAMLGPLSGRFIRFQAFSGAAGFLAFGASVLAGMSANARIVIFTLMASVMVPWTAWRYLAGKGKTRVRIAIGVLLLLLFASFLVRVAETATLKRATTIFASSWAQNFFYIIQFLYMLLVGAGIILFSKEKSSQRLVEAMTHDALTGILNRGAFEDAAWRAISMCSRNDIPFTMMMFDLDHFKEINDLHGHHAGDLVLEDFASTTAAKVRNYDYFGRYGGDEFILLLQSVDASLIDLIATRLRTHVGQEFPEGLPYTVSTGAVFVQRPRGREITLEALTIACDKAMYEAKAAGPGNIVVREF